MSISGNNRYVFILAPLITGIFLFNACANNKNKIPVYEDFAGSQSCIKCHTDIYQKHLATAHFNSTAPASINTIKGSFDSSHNSFAYDLLSRVIMEERGDSFYQVHYLGDKEINKSRFDIVVGSGKKGQSFLSWKKNSLIQMPITYFTPENTWSTSPGFSSRNVAFNRVVTSRCLECHSTYFERTSAEGIHPEQFNQQKIIYAITCEKCHGPAKEHVTYHTNNPAEKTAHAIINPAKLSRQKNLDLCTLCHGGRLEKTKPSFSFTAGDDLKDYFNIQPNNIPAANLDVHGNQFGSLSASKCFLQSQMTCLSCHNVHENESGKTEVFSAKCLTCHTGTAVKTCKLKAELGETINKNCIDCHMPYQQSQSIVVFLEGSASPTPAKLRNHYITIYKEESDRVREFLKSNHQQGK